MDYSGPLSQLGSISPAIVDRYRKLGIETIDDLLLHCPARYDDFSSITPIAQLQPGLVTIKATVKEISGRYTRFRGLHITEALVADDSGPVRVRWYNQPYRAKQFGKQPCYFSGRYGLQSRSFVLLNPTTQQIADDGQPPDLVRPVYPLTAGLTQLQVRRHLQRLKDDLADLAEPWPDWLTQAGQFDDWAQTLTSIHFPASLDQALAAQRELGRRQMLVVALASSLLRQQLAQQKRPRLKLPQAELAAAAGRLEFELTDEQKDITRQLAEQLAAAEHPLNCLLHGDVGFGKTVVAGLLAQLVMAGGGQVALMAPTEILVDQHHQTLKQMFDQTWVGKAHPRLARLAGRQPAKEVAEIRQAIAAGQIDLVIGTHSLLSDKLQFANLQLAIVDEQHRFGVAQRRQLVNQAGVSPHFLALSATPIPRSLALVLYGELDIYRLTQKLPGRQDVKTEIIPKSGRPNLWRRILESASPQNQVYIVCPAITSEAVGDTIAQTTEAIKKFLDPDQLAVLHGQLAGATKLERARDFRDGKSSVLLATSMLEAGIDNPNVHTIIILSPERFGLAQLHQLRGRVGRGEKEGVCYLASASNEAPGERLLAVRDHHDGFALSELDLKLRGPGSLYGTRQWGALKLDLAPWLDSQAIDQARELAGLVLERITTGEFQLKSCPSLARAVDTAQSLVHLN